MNEHTRTAKTQHCRADDGKRVVVLEFRAEELREKNLEQQRSRADEKQSYQDRVATNHVAKLVPSGRTV